MGRAECRQCGGDVVEVCPECEKSELASLRAKLAEAETELAKAAGVSALREASAAFGGDCAGCESKDEALSRLANERTDIEAKLAEWEAAGRVLAKYIYENGRGCGTRTAIEREDDLKIHRGNLYANPLASRLVAEAGGTNG